MPTSRDELAQLNFGYLKGSDLLQFAPTQLLTAQYDKYPDIFQLGCSMAYDELGAELGTRYDTDKELSNYNQKLKAQTGSVTFVVPAGSNISRVILTWDTSTFTGFNKNFISPEVSIGLTEAGTEIYTGNINYQTVVWVNRYFDTQTNLYFVIDGGTIDIDIACNRLNLSPTMSVIEQTNSSNFTLTVPANSYIYGIFGSIILDHPVVTVGTTLGDNDVVLQTTIANAALVIEDGMNYFDTETVLYFTVTGGTVATRIDIGYNYVNHITNYTQPRCSLFVKLASIMALCNILGSASGENKLIQSHYEWLKETIYKIKARQMSLKIDSAPVVIASRANTISSSFKTIG